MWKLLLAELSECDPPTATAFRGECSERERADPLRVLFVQDHLGQTAHLVHGVTRYLLSTLPAFDRSAVEPLLCVLTPRHPIGAPLLEAQGIEAIFLRRGKWDPRVVLELIRLVREHNIDLLHVSGFKATMVGRIAGLATGRAMVAHIHDARPMPAWVRLVQHRLARYTDAAIAVSDAMRRPAANDYGMPSERVRVLYNGVRSDPFFQVAADARQRIRAELHLANGAQVIGIVGRIEPGKGVGQLMRAMPAVLERCPDAALLVVGDGPTRQNNDRLAMELGIEAAVRFTGHRNDIPELLSAMDVLAAPAVAEEGLGYAVLEAMCAALPVVASRVGGPAECVIDGETGLLVPIGDVPALAEALVTLLCAPAMREAFGRAARTRSAIFSVQQHVERLQTIYCEIMAARIRQGRPTASTADLRGLLPERDSDREHRT